MGVGQPSNLMADRACDIAVTGCSVLPDLACSGKCLAIRMVAQP